MEKLKLNKPGADRVIEVELPDGGLKKLTITRVSVKGADERETKANEIRKRVTDGKLNGTIAVIQILGLYVKETAKELAWIHQLDDEDYVTQLVEAVMLVKSGKRLEEMSDAEKKTEG